MPDTPSLVEQYRQKKKPSLVQQYEATKPESLTGKVGDALNTVFDTLSWPQQKMFGAITGQDKATGDDVMAKLGMDQGVARAAAGLALDVVADPINLVPGAAFAKVGKGIVGGVKAVDKAMDVVPGVKTVKKIVGEAKDGLGERFVQHYGTDKYVDAATGLSYQDKARLHESSVQSLTAGARQANPQTATQAARRAKQAEVRQFHQDIAKAFGSTNPQPGYRIANAYQKSLGKIHFPEEIAKDLERSATFTGDVPENFWTDSMKLWKSYATSLNPSHHFVNMLGNMQNMYLGGVEGYKLIPKYIEAKNALKNNTISQQMMQAMRKYGVIGDNATFGGSMAPTGRQRATLMTGKWNPLNPENAASEKMRQFGTDWVEEPARVALYMDRINKGDTPEKAALAVKKYLFDYSELTDVERKLRDYAFPFYTFTRKNLPLQIEALLTDPKKANVLGDVLQFFDEASPEATEATQPDYLSKEGFVPAPVEGEDGSPYLMRLALPVQDVNKLSSPKDALQMLGSMLAPHIKVPTELISGHELRGGIPIHRERGVQNPAVWAAAADQLGLDHIPGVERLLGLVDTPQGRKQLDLPAYLMRQIPFGNWLGRSIAPPDAQGGELNPAINALMRFMGTTPVALTPRVQSREAQRRVVERAKAERTRRLIMEQ